MIENKCENRGQHCEDMRAAFEHRATWFYTLINEARKKGLEMCIRDRYRTVWFRAKRADLPGI